MHRRLLSLLRDTRLAFGITVLSALLAGWLTIGQAWLFSNVLSGVFLGAQTLGQVWPALRLLLFIFVARAILAWLNEVSANAIAIRIKTDLRRRLFSHIIRLGPAFSRAERTGELTATAVEGIEALDAYFSQYLPQLLIAAFVPLSILVFILPLDPLSGLILLLTAPLIPLFMYLIGKGAEAVTHRQYETLRLLSAHFLDSLQGLTTLKLFGQSKAHAQTVAQASDQFRDVTMKVLRVTFLSALVLELIATLSTAIIAVEIGIRLLYFGMEFREAFFLLLLAPEFYLPLRMLGQRFHAGMAGTSAARRLFEILDIPSTQSQGLTHQDETNVPAPNTPIRFDDVSFSYLHDSPPALKNINLTIACGKHIALVGKTGAGKSTLTSLLLGFIQPTSGAIYVGDVRLEDINSDQWHEQIAWVPQTPHLFHDTILANIRLGNPNASGEQVIAASQAAHLHEFIESLPQGYQTMIGEGGARLSGGEAQRLALARAFLKAAPILIMDEPTSNLDPENEMLIAESVRVLMQGRTVLTIAHRLNTVFQADQVIVLDSGKIVEQGTHGELMARNGIYASMVNQLGNGISYEKENTIVDDGASIPIVQASNIGLEQVERLSFHDNRSSTFLRLLGFLRGSWGWVALSVVLGALTIGSNIALMGTSAWLISAAALHPSIADLEVAIVGVRFFGLTRGIFRYLERLVSHNVTFQLLARLRSWFYEKLEPLAPARLLDFHTGDLLARIIADVDMLESFYIRVIAPPLTALIVALGTSIFLGSFDLRLGYLILCFMFLVGMGLPLLAQTLSRQASVDLVCKRAELHALLVDGIQGLTDLIAFGRAKDQLELISEESRIVSRAQQRLALVTGLNAGISILLTNLGMWLVLVIAIPLVSMGKVEGVMLGALVLITLASFEAVTPLSLAAQAWESSRAAARRLFEIVDTEPEVNDVRQNKIEVLPVNKTPPALEISNLGFTYPGQTAPALQNISFVVPAGHSLAIVGPSGAGKSTLPNLLLRFWEYSEGDILLDGRSIKEYSQDEIRRMTGVVPQKGHFFNASIWQNLLLANPSASQLEIESAAQQAQIDQFIQSLPNGYETIIGEQGFRLSGGERQRLAIARAILKDAPILILDEPTANLDPLTEKQVLESLFCLMHKKTSLLITHRLIGLENVDEILVMEHGKLLERGIHKTLLEQNGLYQWMWNLQNSILKCG